MTNTKPEIALKEPDWAEIERDVIHKLHLLRAAWEYTLTDENQDVLRRDLYLPCLRLLADFSSSIQEEVEESNVG